MIGYGVATFLSHKGGITKTNKTHYGSLGLLFLLIIPLLPVEGEATSYMHGHPGLFALLVTASTAMVLCFGLPSFFESSKIGKGLEKLGKYSYSIYLVHFPVIVIYNSKPFMGTSYGAESITDLAILIVIITILSIVLHTFFEKRKVPNLIALKWKRSAIIASMITVIVTFSVNIFQANSLDRADQLIFLAEQDRSTYRCGKTFRLLNPRSSVCELTGIPEAQASGAVMLAGNSHADSAKPAFIRAANESNLNLYFFVSNSTMNHDGHSVDFIVKKAKENEVSKIFVHQSPSSFRYQMLSELIHKADKVGIDVVYVEPVPVWPKDIPLSMWKMKSGSSDDVITEKGIEDYYENNQNLFEGLEKLNHSNFSRITIVESFCTPICEFKNKDGAPLYFDSHHLTKTGAERLYPKISEQLSELVSTTK